MLKSAQILCLLVISLLFLASIYGGWLGLSPELTFLEFLNQSKTLLPILGLITLFGSFLAFIMGWNPNIVFVAWLRSKIVVPVFLNIKMVSFLGIVLLIPFVWISFFILTFERKNDADVIDAVISKNFDLADKLITSEKRSSNQIADLNFINDSERQLYFRSTGDPDPNLCRIYHSYFSSRRHAFQPIWKRYAFNMSRGACLIVLDDPKQALSVYQKALRLARWLSIKEQRLTARRVAGLYMRDTKGYSDIPKQEDRLKKVLSLLATDPSSTAKRLRGSAKYLRGEYSNAAREFQNAVAALADTEKIEKKRLLNNLALSYNKISQNTLAMQRVEQGLSIPFDEEDENERREQIRLLASKLQIQKDENQCRPALQTFQIRENLKRQERSPCNALIETKLHACVIKQSGASELDRRKLLNAILFGIGQEVTNFSDYTEPALKSLAEQAKIKFNECYVGLNFDLKEVQEAILKLVR